MKDAQRILGPQDGAVSADCNKCGKGIIEEGTRASHGLQPKVCPNPDARNTQILSTTRRNVSESVI